MGEEEATLAETPCKLEVDGHFPSERRGTLRLSASGVTHALLEGKQEHYVFHAKDDKVYIIVPSEDKNDYDIIPSKDDKEYDDILDVDRKRCIVVPDDDNK